MNSQHNMEERLWSYIDGASEQNEKSAIEELLQKNAEWQKKYRDLLDIHTLLNATELEEPSMRFTKNVMEEIARYQIAPATKTYINKNIIRSIAAFFIIMLAGLLIYGFAQVNWSSTQPVNSSVLNSVTKFDNSVSTFNFSKIFNNTYMTAFMMINVVLGLMLLDRYLAKKKKESQAV